MLKLITLPGLGEHAGRNATYVFLADAVISYLRPQRRHTEHMEVAQVGQTHKAILTVVLSSSTAEVHQGHFAYTAALMRSQFEFGFCADFRQHEHLQWMGHDYWTMDTIGQFFSLVYENG